MEIQNETMKHSLGGYNTTVANSPDGCLINTNGVVNKVGCGITVVDSGL